MVFRWTLVSGPANTDGDFPAGVSGPLQVGKAVNRFPRIRGLGFVAKFGQVLVRDTAEEDIATTRGEQLVEHRAQLATQGNAGQHAADNERTDDDLPNPVLEQRDIFRIVEFDQHREHFRRALYHLP